MYVETAGDPGGPPVVFLHAAQVSGWMWTDVVQSLQEFHCIVPDLPGIDRSAGIPWKSLDDSARQVVELIGEQRKAHLVGLSLGAAVALRVVSVVPGRIDRAVLSGTLTRPVTGALAQLNRLLVWLYGNPLTVPLLARMLRIPPDAHAAFAATARRTPKETYRRVMDELHGEPWPGELGTIDVPTLAITGARDASLLRLGVEDLVRSLPAAAGFLVPGVGHQWSAEDPERFREVVRAWLLGVPLPAGLIPVAARERPSG
jgi:pimeloyl-ACP methyl ester carboxylesterase